VLQNKGSSVNKSRQEGPHAHWAALDPGRQFLMACDLGIDRVVAARFDSATGCLETNLVLNFDIAAGSGPRHLAFHPSNRFAYVLNELNSTITVFGYDSGNGRLTFVQTVPTVPPGAAKNNSGAEIAIDPSGRFVYASNRGHDSLVSYEVNPRNGRLNFIGYMKTGGRTPRHFAIDPSGGWLLAANQDGNSISIFRINKRTGDLDAIGEPVALNSPVCIQFIPRP
jgi:6-phosphogluconolactonase